MNSEVTGTAPRQLGTLRQPSNDAALRVPHLRHDDLMYVSDTPASEVLVFTYPQGTLAMTLSSMAHPRGECVDSAGNVYITNSNASYSGSIYIFAHGANSPYAILNFPDAIAPSACSVDPTTGDLAVTNSTDQVEVYDPASQSWSDHIDVYMSLSGVAYDSDGDLFVGGPGGKYRYFSLAEIPKSGKCFCSISLNENIGGSSDTDYSLQWDGKYLALTNLSHKKHLTVYRLSVNGSVGMVVSTSQLRGTRNDSFTGGYSWIRGNVIIAPNKRSVSVAFWKYPLGGRPTENITDPSHQFVGVTVSNGGK